MTTPWTPPTTRLEGSTETEHTLYSHTASSSSEIDSFKKLEYIYQHFQDSEKIHESYPDAVRHKTLYTHILTMILNVVYLKMLSIAII